MRRATVSTSRSARSSRIFYKELMERTGIADPAFAAQMDRNAWPALKDKLAAVIKTKTRDEWDCDHAGQRCVLCAGAVARRGAEGIRTMSRGRPFVEVGGVTQPAPSPALLAHGLPQVQGPPGGGRQRGRAGRLGLFGGGRRETAKRGCDLASLSSLPGTDARLAHLSHAARPCGLPRQACRGRGRDQHRAADDARAAPGRSGRRGARPCCVRSRGCAPAIRARTQTASYVLAAQRDCRRRSRSTRTLSRSRVAR